MKNAADLLALALVGPFALLLLVVAVDRLVAWATRPTRRAAARRHAAEMVTFPLVPEDEGAGR